MGFSVRNHILSLLPVRRRAVRLQVRRWYIGHPLRIVASATAVALSISIASSAVAQPRNLHGHKVVRVTVANKAELAALREIEAASRDIEIWSEDFRGHTVDVRVSPKQKRALDRSGFRYEVLIEDLQAKYDELFSAPEGAGFFGAYRTYAEHVAFMNDLVATYPDLATMVNLGESWNGRILWAIHITGPGGDKPGVMYHGAQHGNEIMGPCVVAYLAQQLLANYNSDPVTAALVDNMEWFLLPIMNPDGYEAGSRYNDHGVDLNRNWGGPGTGASAFSEPETVAMRDFFLSHPNVQAHVDLHSYGYAIIWPWGHKEDLCDDHLTFKALGKRMADEILEVRDVSYDTRGSINRALYPVIGGSVDYSYGELGVWGMVFEIGYTFSMPFYQILPTSEEIGQALTFLSDWIIDCNNNGILDLDEIAQGISTDCNYNGTPDVCESDLDSNSTIDACDPDIDGDGVLNELDACLYRPVRAPTIMEGFPFGDLDRNCTVDLFDYRNMHFYFCFSENGPGILSPYRFCLREVDADGDKDIDLADFAIIQRAFDPETSE